ncbi:hypothetical protein HS125_11880 [bacterium]|nr:hypothetical protein [bacterium]
MAASLLVPPLCGASTTLVRGLVGAPDDGFQQSWHTHLGFQPVIGVRQKAPDLSMYWGTAFVPRRVETETVTFSWVGAMGGGVSSAGNFTLSVNGHPVVQFDVVSRSTHFPARYSSCDLYYDVLWTRPGGRWTENALDTSGHFFLVVDASALEPGRPVILSVTGTDIGEHRWFGIIYDATMVPAMPQRRWREFRRYPEPAQPPPATAEAGFEHYLPQYSDPGCFTPIGWPADPAETAVSPTGQLMSGLDYTRYGSGVGRSEPPYYRHSLAFAVWDGQRLVPVGAGAPARQNLYRGRYPMVYTNWTWSDFSLQGTAFSEPLAGDGYASGTERTLAWAVWDIRNYAREPREITLVAFYVGDEDAPAPEMVWRDGAVHRDGSALFSAAPSEGFSQEFHPVFPPGLVIDASRPFDALIEDRGAANALVVRGTLRPGESKHVAFNRVFDYPDAYHWKAPQLPPVPAEALTARACEAAFKRTAERWETLEKRFCFFRTPRRASTSWSARPCWTAASSPRNGTAATSSSTR